MAALDSFWGPMLMEMSNAGHSLLKSCLFEIATVAGFSLVVNKEVHQRSLLCKGPDSRGGHGKVNRLAKGEERNERAKTNQLTLKVSLHVFSTLLQRASSEAACTDNQSLAV